MLRDRISDDLKLAQKALDKRRISTLRLIHAAIVDRDIALRGKGKDKADDEEVLDILAKMVKQREESSKIYAENGRKDLEEQELQEILIVKGYLPEQLNDADTEKAVLEAISETKASSLRDMGKVMGHLKEHFRGQIDFGKAGSLIKAKLGA